MGEEAAQGQFQAGVGRVSITPPLSAPHAGWGAQTHVFPDGVETDLWATVLVVEDGTTRAAYVDLDLVLISRQESDAIRAAVAQVLDIPPANVRLSVTHNHAGPPPSSWDWMEEGQEALRGYYALLPSLAAGAARLALLHLTPARLAAGHGEARVGINRRETSPSGRTVTGTNPDGPTDPEVLVVRIATTAGEPLAAIVGYTMHPTTMGPSNRRISADWPGHLKRTLETLTGATVLFAQGSTGDVGPGPEGYTDDARVIERLGVRVAAAAAQVYFGLQLPPVSYRHERVQESGAPLGIWRAEPREAPPPVVRVAHERVAMPVRPQPARAEAEAAVVTATERLRRLSAEGAPAEEIEAATFVVKRANMTLSRAKTFGGSETFPIELHLLQLGPVVFVGAEIEPFSAIGKEVKSRSPFADTWFGGYTGGWFGYVPTPEEFPRQGYEVETSPYTEAAAGVLADAAVAALGRLAERKN